MGEGGLKDDGKEAVGVKGEVKLGAQEISGEQKWRRKWGKG